MAPAVNSSSSSSSSLSNNRSNSEQVSGIVHVASVITPAWTQIVRGGSGGDSDASGLMAAVSITTEQTVDVFAAAVSPSDSSPAMTPSGVSGGSSSLLSSLDENEVTEGLNSGNGNASKKPVWNKPSNGADAESGLVIGADWPSLPGSFRGSSKPVYSDPKRPLYEGSLSGSQSTGIPNATTHKNHTSSQNHQGPSRSKSFKQRHGGYGPANGGLTQPTTIPSLLGETAPTNHNSNTHKNLNSESGYRSGSSSNSHGGNDHQFQRNSVRRSNGGNYPRGNGNHNYGGRLDHDRVNRDWNFQRIDGHMQAPVVPRGFMRPIAPPPPPPPPLPQITPTYVPPPLVPHFPNQIGYPGVPAYYVQAPPPDAYRAVPYGLPVPHLQMYLHPPLSMLQTKVLNQINYYFSDTNLVKDVHLRRQMDNDGWVNISVIARFNKILEMTEDIELILSAIQASHVVEVQGYKLRKRGNWSKYVLEGIQDGVAHDVRSLILENNYERGSTSVQPNSNDNDKP